MEDGADMAALDREVTRLAEDLALRVDAPRRVKVHKPRVIDCPDGYATP